MSLVEATDPLSATRILAFTSLDPSSAGLDPDSTYCHFLGEVWSRMNGTLFET